MIRYSTLYDNDKQHKKKIDEQEILFEKMSRQLVKMNNNMLRFQEKILEKETKILELEGCVSNKDVEIEKCLERLNECENKLHKMGQTNQTIHMIMPYKDTLYNGLKGIDFENPNYFEKAKDLRPSLYDEKVIGLGYTLMFLTHLNEALEIEKFKRARENKIEFAYDYGNLNTSYVNEKINFSDDYFQEIINPNFEKIDSPFQQTSSLKPYVSTVILEKIIIDLEDEVVSLLEKEKANLETIESLKSKDFESSENAISESENQSENDCQVVEKSVTKWLCDSFDENNLFIFDYKSVRISPASKMPFRKKPYDSINIVQIFLWIIDSRCSKHMTGNRALLTNFVKKFLGTVRFSNNGFSLSAGYGNVVIGSMTIKKVYYSTCFVRSKDGVDLLTGDRSSNLHTIALNEVASNSLTFLLEKASSSQSWLTPQQNGVVERRNRTLVEATRTMLTFANLPLFLWAESIATTCFTQNHSIIHKRFDKTPYELRNKRKPNIKFFRMFECRCYLLNDYEDVGKLKAKGDIGVFIGYSKESGAFRIYNKRTRKIHERMNVNFDEISEMASKQFSLEPGLSNLNETGKFSDPSIMKFSTTNVETSNVEISLNEEEVFHESSESFQEESSSSSLNDDV
nr:retrovirus-related Pol polyprotein from transposon TNT 1-94 [Tanacetum cinerariifolium]